MWCSTCQQDVPGLGPPSESGDLRCGKCGENLLPTGFTETAHRVSEAPAGAAVARTNVSKIAAGELTIPKLLASGPLAEDDWALEAELRGVQRLIGSLKSRSTIVAEPVAVHAIHGTPAGWHAGGLDSVASRRATNESINHNQRPRNAAEVVPYSGISVSTKQPREHMVAWLVLSLGLAVFACGVVLLGWSLLGRRDDLWAVGLPLTLIGQAGLILGLILQLDGLWQTSRKTEAALGELDDELRNVWQATTLLPTANSAGPTALDVHPPQGARPHLQLADLTGQLDSLAHQRARGKG